MSWTLTAGARSISLGYRPDPTRLTVAVIARDLEPDTYRWIGPSNSPNAAWARAPDLQAALSALAALGFAPPPHLVADLAAYRGLCLHTHRGGICRQPYRHDGAHTYEEPRT